MDTPVGYQSFVLYVTMSFCAMSPPDLLYVMILRELPSREIDFWSKSKVTYISAILYIDLWHGDKNQSVSQSNGLFQTTKVHIYCTDSLRQISTYKFSYKRAYVCVVAMLDRR